LPLGSVVWQSSNEREGILGMVIPTDPKGKQKNVLLFPPLGGLEDDSQRVRKERHETHLAH